jgi:hypothetical protein
MSGEKKSFMRFEYLEGACERKTLELTMLSAAVVAGCRH